MAWYEENFSDKYLELYAHRNKDEGFNDVEKVTKLIKLQQNAEILDLCCGAGRHLLALHQLGFNKLSGLDLSRDLLKKAQSELLEADINAKLIQADMRYIPQELTFDCILSLFTSFGYFKSDSENKQVISGAYNRLKTNGIMLMDTINPSYLEKNIVKSEEKIKNDTIIQIKRNITKKNPRVEKTTTITHKDGQIDKYFESVRLFSAQEFIDMYHQAGFCDIKLYGSLDAENLTIHSPRLIIIAKKC